MPMAVSTRKPAPPTSPPTRSRYDPHSAATYERRPLHTTPVVRVRVSVEIEKLILWAYRDELSKRVTSSAEGIWDRVEEIGSLGGIDPMDKRTPQRYDFGLPDPDALAIEAAISDLPEKIVDWESSRGAIMGHLAPLLVTRDVLLVRPVRPTVLVAMHAKMNSRPQWDRGETKPHPVMAVRGIQRPAIVGECRGNNLYTAGSYCPLRWDPSPVSIAIARIEYAVWHQALCTLAETLDLARHIALPPTAPAQPWLGDAEPLKRIHIVGESGSSGTSKLPLRPRRALTGASRPRTRNSAVRKIALDKGSYHR